MIEAESLIYTKLATALRTAFPGIFVTGEKVAAPESFPCVSIVEQGNSTYRRSLDGEPTEHHANLMYEIECYSNKQPGRKTECRQIAAVFDEIMLGLYFTRTFLEPIPNAVTSIYRIVGRYTAVISEDGYLYRR